MRLALALTCLLALAACGGRPGPDDPPLSDRALDLETFFAGRTVAHGQFNDRFGTVRRRFTVEIDGDWDGRTLTLDERFRYADGSTERRVWSLTKTGEDTWEGTAPGVVGTARGTERGDTFRWGYTIDLPRGDGGTARVSFDDWMWLLTDDRLLNRAWMTRFGVTLGEVIIVFEKG